MIIWKNKETSNESSKETSSRKWFKFKRAIAAASAAVLIACSPVVENDRLDFHRKDLENTWWVKPYEEWYYRGGEAYTYITDDWTRVFWLTQNEVGRFNVSKDGTYYGKVANEVYVKPDWRVSGKMTKYHSDLSPKSKYFERVPDSWIDPFTINFGDNFTSPQRTSDSLKIELEKQKESIKEWNIEY